MPTPARDIIVAYNSGRDPERLAMKYQAMAADPFAFLRGTCHLFHRRFVESDLATGGPPTWICGDLHLENFGTYLGDNDLTYFDVNDFDEAALAPCSWDIVRLATSLIVAAPGLGLKQRDRDQLALELTETWRAELAGGKPRWIERKTAKGIIGGLMDDLKNRRTVKFLDKRTALKKGNRKLLIGSGKALAINDDERARLTEFVPTLARGPQDSRFFTFLDAARRIAGTGSLGIVRFILLIEGDGSPDQNVLLDLKEAAPSAAAVYSPCTQPVWPDEAHRIVAATSRSQAIAPSLLQALTFMDRPFVLKELQPTADRLNLSEAAGDIDAFHEAVLSMGRLAAWAHLRATGRDGSATADTLIAYASDTSLVPRILSAARAMADITHADWDDYCEAFRAGEIAMPAPPGKPESTAA